LLGAFIGCSRLRFSNPTGKKSAISPLLVSGFALMDEDSDDHMCVAVLVSCKLIYQHPVTLAVRGFINLRLSTYASCLKKIGRLVARHVSKSNLDPHAS
jgi:hypothetical protein